MAHLVLLGFASAAKSYVGGAGNFLSLRAVLRACSDLYNETPSREFVEELASSSRAGGGARQLIVSALQQWYFQDAVLEQRKLKALHENLLQSIMEKASLVLPSLSVLRS